MILLPDVDAAIRLGSALERDDLDVVKALVKDRGDALLAAGHSRLVARATQALSSVAREAHDEELLGLALLVLGDGRGAHAALADSGGALQSSRAWRLGMLHHLEGEPAAALEVMARAELSGSHTINDVHLLSWSAASSWMIGDAQACGHFAEQAQRAASYNGADAAVASAQVALALHAAQTGDRRRNAWHWERALEAAQRAGDVLQEIRIRANIGSHLLEEGRYAAAAVGLREAAALAEQVGFAVFAGLSSCNLGECLLSLGRLDDAATAFESARLAWQRSGSRMIAYALTGLGDTYRERRDLALARAAYQEAVEAAGPGHPQALVPALDGLARTLSPDDAQAAWLTGLRADEEASDMERLRVRLTIGWLGFAAGRMAEAADSGILVADEAVRRRDRAALGEALELKAMCADGDARRRLLAEAAAVWHDIGHELGSRRVDYALRRLSGEAVAAPAEDRPGSACRPHAAGLLAAVEATAGPRVEVRVLGKFEVLRDGRPVAEREWQSRKARELVRILIARRGRPIGREALAELLWPGEDMAALANRLSVALAVVRRVFDPGRVHPQGHFVRGEESVVALDLEHLCIDVEDFLREAAAGLALRAISPKDGFAQLQRAVDRYSGEALVEDAYADWAIPLRDEARTQLLAATRALAEHFSQTEPAKAVPYLMRALDQDGYDEPVHLLLVRALNAGGRFGEARRAYGRYAARMGELGLDAAPFPSPAMATRTWAAVTELLG